MMIPQRPREMNLPSKQGGRLKDLQKWVGYWILLLKSNNFQNKLLTAKGFYNFKTVKTKEWKSEMRCSLNWEEKI